VVAGAQLERLRSPLVLGTPHPLLAPHLARRYTGFVERTQPRHLVIPASATVSVVVKLRDSAHRPAAFVKGPQPAHLVPEGECAASYLEVRLGPLSGYTLLGVPLNALGGRIVDLRDLLGADGRRLAERLCEARSWRHRFVILDQLFLQRLDGGPRPSPEVVRVLQRLVATGGADRIGHLAREVGWSHKHLITRFTQQVGLSPKAAARLVRFDRVLRRLDQPDAPRWERIAAEAGYADQSHLVREFRTFTGVTPTAFPAGARARRGAAPVASSGRQPFGERRHV
jgi:AraC-like DNA-binding protein